MPDSAEPVGLDSSNPEPLADEAVEADSTASVAGASMELPIDAATIRSKFEARLESGSVREVSLPQQAYELMTERLGSAQFDPWDELPDSARGSFKERFARIEALPPFERCAAILLITAALPQ